MHISHSMTMWNYYYCLSSVHKLSKVCHFIVISFSPSLFSIFKKKVKKKEQDVLFAHLFPFLKMPGLLLVSGLGFFDHRHGCNSTHTGENGMTFTRAARR